MAFLRAAAVPAIFLWAESSAAKDETLGSEPEAAITPEPSAPAGTNAKFDLGLGGAVVTEAHRGYRLRLKSYDSVGMITCGRSVRSLSKRRRFTFGTLLGIRTITNLQLVDPRDVGLKSEVVPSPLCQKRT